MLTFKELHTILTEKLIVTGRGKKQGQILLLVGGGGSGKGFAAKNFINAQDYKTVNVDDLKTLITKNPKSAFYKADLTKDEVTGALHKHVKEKGWDMAIISNLAKSTKESNKGRKPEDRILDNILFDITLRDISKLGQILPQFIELGYDPKNVHIVWVLTSLSRALDANLKRSRRVPEETLKLAHKNIKDIFKKILKKGSTFINKALVDGELYVILNLQELTVFFDVSGKSKSQNANIKDFTYVQIKDSGKSINYDSLKVGTVQKWMKEYANIEE